MNNFNRKHIFTIFWLLIALVSILAMGALQRQQQFLTRGIPNELPPPMIGAGVELGLNVYLDVNDPQLDETLADIAALGVQTIKQPFYYSPEFDWDATERLVTAVSAHNLTLVPLLDGDPDNQFAPVETAVFAAWTSEFAARFSDTITHYIIWDEPNLTTHWGNRPVNPAAYGALLSAAADAIRAADADALIVAAPLAPTMETGPMNLTEPIFLKSLYESGAGEAFDIIAAKPYGFYTGPDDRRVAQEVLNFSRPILLREVMDDFGDTHKTIWAGNWGWNSLPENWQGNPSIWGVTTSSEQANATIAGLTRAQQEWPWMGVMFLESWQPDAGEDDPRWGFAVAGSETAVSIQAHLAQQNEAVAQPGFYLAAPGHPAQQFQGGWKFSPEYGADISETPDDMPGDRVTFTFWGTDAGLRVRRADYRARLYVTIDGQPANALPQDNRGSTLVLTAPDDTEDYVATEWVAHDLTPGPHMMEIEAFRGWDQWALNGFAVGYRPDDSAYRWQMVGVAITAVFATIMTIRTGRRADWGKLGQQLRQWYGRLSERKQGVITAVTAAIVALTGWLTWGEQAAGIYRRLGDSGQLALTAAAASIFYVTPTFFIYAAALAILFVLIYFRPAWGVALIAFSFPLSVNYVLKDIFHYRFSPVEIFTLITVAAVGTAWITTSIAQRKQQSIRQLLAQAKWQKADVAVAAFVAVATVSLLFTERLSVATNEWRMVIIEPALFYLLLRLVKLEKREFWIVLDAFVLSGVLVAVVGLWQYLFDTELLITAEGGLMRVRSFYGSPNNVGLYLGRILPLLGAMVLFGSQEHGRQRWVYTAVFPLIGIVTLLTFSRGAIFLGLPAAFLFIFWQWQQLNGRRTWPWMLGLGVAGVVAFVVAMQIPQLAGRLDPRGNTSFLRVNLWKSSWRMFLDHPVFGVGLDNFLYAYRGRYILDAAWQEDYLNHPHNILLDFVTRLGLLGLIAGGWMVGTAVTTLTKLKPKVSPLWLPVVIGFTGTLIDMVVHGLVDHSFFLVDLSFVFYLVLGTAVWLGQQQEDNEF
ncbi:MAG: hypothetical protein DWQ04_26555 [Chloroflexi bacterium]|nr:MAG: hypothetical protein DWQ04_26555 [Chloroflexota bacterium]